MSGILKLIGKKGVFEVLDYLSGVERARFRDINAETQLPCQATLSQALQLLHKLGFINRKTFDTPGESPVAYYFIEDKGRELLNLMNDVKELEKQ